MQIKPVHMKLNKMMVVSRSKWISLACIFQLLIVHAASLKIAVLGAGASGLAAAKNAIEQQHVVDVYEKADKVGGNWVYSEKAGMDYSPMYFDLKANTPTVLMGYPGFDYPPNTPTYPSHREVSKFLESYANNFNITKRTKFRHKVQHVSLYGKDKWNVTVRNLINRKESSLVYDAVFVCTSIFDSPRIPEIKNLEKYKGFKMHSHDYRRARQFIGKKVLVIGSGRSASDIVIQVSAVTSVTSSQYEKPNETEQMRKIRLSEFGNAATFKYTVDRFTRNGVVFKDGTKENFDVVIFATGYRCTYSFLNADTGMVITDNYIKPLFKQILNIEHPTMAFIGVAVFAVNNYMYDLEARFALEFISGRKQLPSKEEMYASMEKDMSNVPVKSKPHFLALNQKQYNLDLSETAGIENMKEVYSDILADQVKTFKMDPIGFRDYNYIIHGDEFEKVYIKKRKRSQL